LAAVMAPQNDMTAALSYPKVLLHAKVTPETVGTPFRFPVGKRQHCAGVMKDVGPGYP
jgi:hypothetical protein